MLRNQCRSRPLGGRGAQGDSAHFTGVDQSLGALPTGDSSHRRTSDRTRHLAGQDAICQRRRRLFAAHQRGRRNQSAQSDEPGTAPRAESQEPRCSALGHRAAPHPTFSGYQRTQCRRQIHRAQDGGPLPSHAAMRHVDSYAPQVQHAMVWESHGRHWRCAECGKRAFNV